MMWSFKEESMLETNLQEVEEKIRDYATKMKIDSVRIVFSNINVGGDMEIEVEDLKTSHCSC